MAFRLLEDQFKERLTKAKAADARFMQLALALGRRGLGRTWPNPAVGAVIVKDGVIVGRGWTQPGGRPHAEIEALRLLFYRAGCFIRDGTPLSYETAMAKVYADETGQKLARLGMDLLGVWGPLRAGSRWAKLGGQISHLYQTTLGHTIAGGTAEVLRNTVAVRGLGGLDLGAIAIDEFVARLAEDVSTRRDVNQPDSSAA